MKINLNSTNMDVIPKYTENLWLDTNYGNYINYIKYSSVMPTMTLVSVDGDVKRVHVQGEVK